MLTALLCSSRYSRPSHSSVQSRSAELLHHHQQRHYSKRGGEPRRPRIQPDRSPGDLLPLRGVGQPRGSHQTAQAPGPVLQTGRQDPAQRTVNAPLRFQLGFICLLGSKYPIEMSHLPLLHPKIPSPNLQPACWMATQF